MQVILSHVWFICKQMQAETVLAPLVFSLSGGLKQRWAGKSLTRRQTTRTTNFAALADVVVAADGSFR